MQRVIGIDFGTSTTYMNVKRYNGGKPMEDKFSYMPVMFNYGESSGFVASIVRENADGTFDFGERAAEPLEGARVHTEFKMCLESPDDSERAEARRITKEFFKFLHETYRQQDDSLGAPDDEAETIVSYPVKWQKETAQFMLDAAREAGFTNVSGMDEATAAVSTVVCRELDDSGVFLQTDRPGYLMLIDMGAGTTDLVICEYLIRSTGGIATKLITNWPQSADQPTFGGREVDKALERYVEDYLNRALKPDFAHMAHTIAAMPGQAKLWKERNVSVNLAANKNVTTCGYLSNYTAMGILTGAFPAFGRKEFDALLESGQEGFANLVLNCQNKAAEVDKNFASSGLDLVILTGGHSVWYFVRNIVNDLYNAYTGSNQNKSHQIINLPNPQSTVSLGLVYSKLPMSIGKQETKELKKTESKKTEPPRSEPEPYVPPQPEPQPVYTPPQPTKEGKTMEYTPARSGACTLTIRRAMLPIAKWYMEVDDNELYELKGGAVVQVSVEPGTHTLSFCHVPHKPSRASICFEVSRDMDMTVKTVSMGLASGFSLYEGTRIVGTEKLTKPKKK